MSQEAPIIILGNQKSGTTAIASLLADYGGLTKTLDIPEIWSTERALHEGTVSFQSFVENQPHRFSAQVIKEPCLTFLYEKCKESFSSSPYMFIIRHPADNIRSILDRLKIPGNKDHIDLKDYDVNEVWSYVMNGQLLNIDYEHYIARLAMRWVKAAEVYLQHPENMTLVRYEDFMQNKYETIERVANNLGVLEKEDIRSLLHVQYQPQGNNRGNSVVDFFGEKNLSIIFDICDKYMKLFNYSATECYPKKVAKKQVTVSTHADNTPLKVCYLLLHIPVPSETFVINEILALQSVGVDVHTVALWPPQDCHEELMARIRNPVCDLSAETMQQKSAKSSYYPSALKLAEYYNIMPALAAHAALAAEYVINHEINHIHSHFASEAALVSLLVSKLTGIPYSFTAHAYDVFRLDVAGEANPERRLKLLVEHAAKLITVSEYNRKHFLALTDQTCADKLEIVHYGMDLERFNMAKRKSTNCVTFLSVGRLVEKKGYEYLLRSFKSVLETCDAQLRIAGDGYLKPTLAALVSELGIGEKVTFIGAVSTDVVLHEMQQADVFVLHSVTGNDGDREGMPVSIMEACVTGLPVVSTRHAGIPELIIEGGSGFLVDERDVDGFSEAMRTLAESPDLRAKMGLAGHVVVAENFNILHEAQKLKGIFAAIVGESLAVPIKKTQELRSVNTSLNTCRLDFNELKQILKRFIKVFLCKIC